MTQQAVPLSDTEMKIVQAYADERGLTLDEAATELMQQAIARRFKQHLNRRPAQVYSIDRQQK